VIEAGLTEKAVDCISRALGLRAPGGIIRPIHPGCQKEKLDSAHHLTRWQWQRRSNKGHLHQTEPQLRLLPEALRGGAAPLRLLGRGGGGGARGVG
jgi:hypothetical protein